MTAVRHIDEIDAVTFWRDVYGALVDCCDLPAKDAAYLVGRHRADLSCQSEFGRLLVYHESVPNAAYAMWRSTRDCDDEEAASLREKLVRWYSERALRP